MTTIRIAAAALLLAAASSSASAQTTAPVGGFYIGAEGGVVSYSVSESDVSTRTSSISKNAGALRVLMGYRFTPNWAVEMGYAGLGDYEVKTPMSGGRDFTAKASTDAFDISVLYKLTQGLPGLYVRAGLMNSTVSVQQTYRSGGQTYRNDTFSKSGNGYQFALGYEYDMTQHLSANAAYTRMQRLGGDWGSDTKANANLYTVGLKYRF